MILRIARPTDDPDRLAMMYASGLGLRILGRFVDHDGFDGVMVGDPDADYHLEFTREHSRSALQSPSPDALLAFYEPDRTAWEARCLAMARAGFTAVASHNPYWDVNGRTYQDPDGYRIVIQNAPWKPAHRE